MLKPSPFLSRDVFVTGAPSSTAAGLVCRGAVGEQGETSTSTELEPLQLYPIPPGAPVLSTAIPYSF